MPKAGETPEMGANPMLGFGRVYARPELARTVDRRVRRLLNEPGHTFEQFHEWLQGRGITLWGAAVDTLENTSRFADGQPTGPMAVLPPLRLAAAAVPPVRVLHGLPHRAHAGDGGRRAGLGAARLSHAAHAGRRGHRGRVSGHPPREHPRVDVARQESRASPRTAVGGVGEGRRPPGRGRLEGAVRPCGLHRLRHLRAHVPRRQLDGRRPGHARVPVRRLRGDGGGDAGGQPLRRARRRTARWRCSRRRSTLPCRRRGAG